MIFVDDYDAHLFEIYMIQRQYSVNWDKIWQRIRNIFGISSTLGTKYHYLRHCIDYMRIWKLGICYLSKQSIENSLKTCTMVFWRHRNQRGLLRKKYAIHQFMFTTNPLYKSWLYILLYILIGISWICFVLFIPLKLDCNSYHWYTNDIMTSFIW